MTGIIDRLERRIAEQLVRDAIAKGYCVTIQHWDDDSQEVILAASSDADAIMASMGQTDDVLRFRDRLTGERIGWVLLIYGNGTDLISDASDNEATADLLLEAEVLADKLSDEAASDGTPGSVA